MSAVGLSYGVFIMLRYIPCVPNLLRVFIHEKILNFVKCFYCLCQDDHVIFIFLLIFLGNGEVKPSFSYSLMSENGIFQQSCAQWK